MMSRICIKGLLIVLLDDDFNHNYRIITIILFNNHFNNIIL